MPLPEHWRYALGLAASFALAVGLTLGLRRLAPRIGMVDRPTPRKNHSRPTPLLGGVAIYLATMGGYGLTTKVDLHTFYLMVGAFAVLALGVWDDRVGLRARFRFTIQLLSATGLVAAGLGFHWFSWAPLDCALSILWLIGAMNAANCLDCADGIAAGVGGIAAAAYCLIAIAYGHFAVALMAMAVFGGCLGFLAFNFPPASIFLGDAGSTFLGLLLGALAIESSHGAPPILHPWIIALPLGVAVWDIILVHVYRYRAGTRNLRALLESAGRDHLPHRLQQNGLRPRQVALAVYLMAAAPAILAVLIARYQWAGLAIALSFVLVGLKLGERPFGRLVANLGRRRRSAPEAGESIPTPREDFSRAHRWPAAHTVKGGGQ